MSTAEHIGTRNHAVLHDFETAMQRFTRFGIEPHTARRFALALALCHTEIVDLGTHQHVPVYDTKEQVWEAVDQILGPKRDKASG